MKNFTCLHTTSLEDKEPDDTLFRCFDFNLLGLSFLPPKKKMLEVIESDRKRNRKRSEIRSDYRLAVPMGS